MERNSEKGNKRNIGIKWKTNHGKNQKRVGGVEKPTKEKRLTRPLSRHLCGWRAENGISETVSDRRVEPEDKLEDKETMRVAETIRAKHLQSSARNRLQRSVNNAKRGLNYPAAPIVIIFGLFFCVSVEL